MDRFFSFLENRLNLAIEEDKAMREALAARAAREARDYALWFPDGGAGSADGGVPYVGGALPSELPRPADSGAGPADGGGGALPTMLPRRWQ